MSTTNMYQGKLVLASNGGEEVLCLEEDLDYDGDAGTPLADRIKDAIKAHGDILSVRYYTSLAPLDEDALQEQLLLTLDGYGDAAYCVHYSEITGYLWTDEEIKVGGHDLLAELRSAVGRYLWMSIEYSLVMPDVPLRTHWQIDGLDIRPFQAGWNGRAWVSVSRRDIGVHTVADKPHVRNKICITQDLAYESLLLCIQYEIQTHQQEITRLESVLKVVEERRALLQPTD